MDFYSVDCKREIFKNGKWEANNRTEMLVVLAENKEDALKKINNSLNNRGNKKYINLIHDQLFHIIQIVLTWYALVVIR